MCVSVSRARRHNGSAQVDPECMSQVSQQNHTHLIRLFSPHSFPSLPIAFVMTKNFHANSDPATRPFALRSRPGQVQRGHADTILTDPKQHTCACKQQATTLRQCV